MPNRLLAAVLIAALPQIATAAEEGAGGMLGMDRPPPGVRPAPAPPPPAARPAPAPRPAYQPPPAQPPVYRQPPPVYRPYAGPPPGYPPPPPPYYGGPPPVYRPGPPVYGYGYGPPPRPGFTCSTRRFECDLYRPRPIGSYCECPTPFGDRRPGRVTP